MTQNSSWSAQEQLQRVFQHIAQTSMADMPMANPVIAVEALGFRSMPTSQPDSEDNINHWLLPCEIGVLITPWCMNLILFPKGQKQLFSIGHEYPVHLPSATYVFVGAFHQDLGYYASCSLYSPMFEFVNHTQAREIAQLISSMIWQPDPSDTPPKTANDASTQAVVSRRHFMLGRKHHE